VKVPLFSRLFWKIFVWFWLASIIVFVATAWSTGQLYRSSRDLLGGDSTQEELRTKGAAAISILEAGGQDALRAWLRREGQEGPRRRPPLMLIDAEGRDLSGYRLPRPLEQMARRVVSGESGPEHGPPVMSVEMTGRDGERYFAIAFAPHHGPRRQHMFFARHPEFALLRLVLALLVSGLVCFALARYLVKPVQSLHNATEQIAAGNFDARVGPELGSRRDEIADLGRAFDQMAEKVQTVLDSHQQLLGDVSHELRSPLARLQVALGLARKRANDTVTPELDRIEHECEELNALIGNLISLSRMEAQHEAGDMEVLDLRDLLEEVVADAQFEAQEGDKRVTLEISGELRARGRYELLKSAVDNVVRNAVRYSAEGTEIRVRATSNGAPGFPELTLTVQDQGPGVPEDQLERIFHPFVRTSPARERRTGGHGLGLAIAERAIRLHAGKISARNAEGGGLLVEITLPNTP
jgi:two-component system sensor histidine kinase CpxA